MNEKKKKKKEEVTLHLVLHALVLRMLHQLLDSKYTRAQYMALKALPNDYELAC